MIAAGLLIALTASALFVTQRRPVHRGYPAAGAARRLVILPVSDTARPLPVPAIPAVSVPPSATASRTPWSMMPVTTPVKKPMKALVKPVPLSVALTSTSQGRHMRVGTAVQFTTVLTRGQAAALTLSYRRGRGKKTMVSFAEGSLYSTPWTPSVPGRYEFTATALGSRRQAAVSRPIEIIVDRTAPEEVARDEAVQPLPAEVITPLPPWPVRLPPPPRPVRVRPLRTAVPEAVAPERIAKPERTAMAQRSAGLAPRPAPAMIYHVAAAQLPSSRSAVVLAKAFRLRGSPATTKRMIGYHGKTVYVVVTGSYRRPEEARAAALVLQRSGYPAYSFGGP